jgi:hypothetical protein
MKTDPLKTFFKTLLINIGLLCISIVAVDITIGVLFCKNDVFRGHPLPPFDLFYHQNKIKKEYEVFQEMLQKNREQLKHNTTGVWITTLAEQYGTMQCRKMGYMYPIQQAFVPIANIILLHLQE